MPEIKWEINIGSVLTILGFFIIGSIAWGNFTARMDEGERNFALIRAQLETLQEKVDVMRDQQVKTDTELRERTAKR